MNPWIHTARKHNTAATQNPETVFTRSNGYLGLRGCGEEGAPKPPARGRSFQPD
jgi:trehalose/maltose hydrolase-like predicted phosphorylase